MPDHLDQRPGFSASARWSAGLSVIASCVALLAVVIMVNYIASRHFNRFQWTSDERYRISPMTTTMLETLTNEVKIVVLFDAQSSGFGLVKGLLDQYQLACPRLDVEFVDYVHNPGRAALVKAQYQLPPVDQDLVIFEYAGKLKIVRENELWEYDFKDVFTERGARRSGFRGEQFFTSAIVTVSDAVPFSAYFLQGHGEHDPGRDDAEGYQQFARVLADKNILIKPCSLLTNDVPADCDVLVIAGPRHTLAPEELDRVEKYLNQGGRAFILLMNPLIAGVRKSGLERILTGWGVGIGDALVSDAALAKAGQSEVLFVSRFGQHPIVAPLGGSRLALMVPCSVRSQTDPTRSTDTAKVAELAFTSEGGQERGRAGGAIPLMVAIEKGAIPGVAADRGSARLVVVGDSYFLTNANIEFDGNRDFASLAVNWLLGRTALLDIGLRPIREYMIALTRSEMRLARWILLAGMPGAILLTGLLVWTKRRK